MQVGQVQTVKGSCNTAAWLQHEQVSINHVIYDLPVKAILLEKFKLNLQPSCNQI